MQIYYQSDTGKERTRVVEGETAERVQKQLGKLLATIDEPLGHHSLVTVRIETAPAEGAKEK